MNDRHNDILRIRPQIKRHQTFETMSDEERFQNSTLRPILKLQNPLLLASFVNYATKHKGVFFDIPTDKHCLLYTSPSPRDVEESRMPASA